MSRPKPTILVEHVNKVSYKSEQVLSSEGIWAVFFDGQPINLKSGNMLVSYPGPKYKKTSFSNPNGRKLTTIHSTISDIQQSGAATFVNI